MAGRVGFEPTVGCPTLVFKTSALDHSATCPLKNYKQGNVYLSSNLF